MTEKTKYTPKIGLIGGQMLFEKMTNKVNDKDYAQQKAWMWIQMVNDRKNPTRWLKPNSKGTKVNFYYIHSQEEYEKALNQVEPFLKEINRIHGLDYKLSRGDE